MGINWNKDAIERIIGALLAAHPGFTPDYKTMAVHFGQGATYDSMQGRFREYRKIAQSMRQDNQEPANSRTPIRRTTSGGRISKPSSAAKSGRMQTPLTPTKLGKVKTENGFANPILINEGLDYFVKSNSDASIPYEESPANSAPSPKAKIQNHFIEIGNLKNEYESNNSFSRGCENVAVNIGQELAEAVGYSSGDATYAEYDDTV
ncbi:conserved hypothetical protein [Histoplasma capsulatum G186AR]|uniref:Uncharacterized protein n=2 Tax=Ajellomyces capsulatus TaxID=5037 RepID=C0P061_AJECG|nr:uncharacterized protein HCBG_08780 [Histoplasma capsulatum G186AR]EEH02877.1 conserved hypothetical protein [Histoplasma capsulatum G186AR]KAG5295949.1 hypothetical protein I7I52_06401 [Histoplasma capsulatum]QSS73932.1 hypothetical protein I7I50_08885 [Histoplasma capsulatum G186AR]